MLHHADVDHNEYIVFTAFSSISLADAKDTNNVKCIVGKNNRAIFYTRATLPSGTASDIGNPRFCKQMGIYAYSMKTLEIFSSLGYSQLENTENIEIMRWLDFGFANYLVESPIDSTSVDTIEDLVRVESLLQHTLPPHQPN
jgi:3-deoxy-manno-octulosonate cytidylyltransferase (CMP-KDO synthetase)